LVSRLGKTKGISVVELCLRKKVGGMPKRGKNSNSPTKHHWKGGIIIRELKKSYQYALKPEFWECQGGKGTARQKSNPMARKKRRLSTFGVGKVVQQTAGKSRKNDKVEKWLSGRK